MGLRFLYDTAVFVYAAGSHHPYREPCRAIIERAGTGELRGEASVDLVQELAHVLLRGHSDRKTALGRVGAAAELCRLHPFTPADLPMMLTLLERHEQLQARDAVFAATALNREIPVILSPDRAYDEVHGLRRVDPLDADAVAALAD